MKGGQNCSVIGNFRTFRRTGSVPDRQITRVRKYLNAGSGYLGWLRTKVRVFYTPKRRGLIVPLTRVQTRIETVEITRHRTLFAVLALSRYVDGAILQIIVVVCVR